MKTRKSFEELQSPALLFHGAAQTVTGSMHIVKTADKVVSLDCGLFQGRRLEGIERNSNFPIRPKDIDTLLLSHSHIDHSGNIPHLAKRGFTGHVYATAATSDLCEIMLADSGHIQEEDARYWNEKRARTKAEMIEPLYTSEDAKEALKLFQQMPYNQKFAFGDGSFATFIEAGHILGSSCVLIELNKPKPIRILFSGDLGRFNMPILKDPTLPLPEVDYLITESTYADRRHHNPTNLKEQLAKVVNETREVGGRVIIPSFSVGRTQNVLYYLSMAIRDGLMEPLPIYVDSPLSTNATAVFKKHPECYDEDARTFWQDEGELFHRGIIQYITGVGESKDLNMRTDPHVIIAASGMCENGRILHHLKNNIWNEQNTICIVGFMAQHTLGRRLVERRQEVKIFGRMYPVLARLEILNGFSAHADQDDFKRLYGPIAPNLKAAFVVHGEGPQPAAMERLLYEMGCPRVFVPSQGDAYELE